MSNDDADSIHEVGHRTFIGGGEGFWEAISKLQFDFLVSEGLKPSDICVDVACGALRGGVRLISYLERGHYIGLDKHIELIIYGVANEAGMAIFQEKRPRFIITDQFELERMHAAPTFGIAQSLFSHLTPQDVVLCLTNLRAKVAAGCRFFATFNEVETEATNPESSHSHARFEFTRREIENAGRETGWTPLYIGEWHHPRGQRLMEFRA